MNDMVYSSTETKSHSKILHLFLLTNNSFFALFHFQSIWIVSFVAVVFIGVDLGLLVAVMYSLVTVIVRTQKPHCVLMGKVPGTDIYRDIAIMKDVSITIWCVVGT